MTIAERVLQICETNEPNMTKFANAIGVSPAYISKLKNHPDLVPSDKFITLVAIAYGVNEEWIKTGEGEMMRNLTQEEEIAMWINRMNFKAIEGDKQAAMKQDLINALTKITDDSTWEALSKIVDAFVEDKKKSK